MGECHACARRSPARPRVGRWRPAFRATNGRREKPTRDLPRLKQRWMRDRISFTNSALDAVEFTQMRPVAAADRQDEKPSRSTQVGTSI